MKRIGFMILACAVAFPAAVAAKKGEHPEHPTKKEHPEHPKKKHGKKKMDAKGKWVKDSETMKAFVVAVEEFVAKKEEDEGAFEVADDELGKTWKLSLVRIHKQRIARLGEDKFFACADFQTVGKGKRQKLDLDFFVTRGEDGAFVVDEIPVHKVDGKPRYTYNKSNERVPVAGKKKAEKKMKKKGREHPEHPTGSGQEHPEHPH